MRRGRGVTAQARRTQQPPARTPGFQDRALPSHVRPRRDSDVSSICSSRPSSVTGYTATPANSSATLSSAAMLRAVNSYLSFHSVPTTLHSPYPSARDISVALSFILSKIDYPLSCHPDRAIEEELPRVLRSLGYPLKLNKSALKSPGTPHGWPSILAALHFLVQLAGYHDHLASSPSSSFSPPAEDSVFVDYLIKSYVLYINGDDDAVERLDEEHLKNNEKRVEEIEVSVKQREKDAMNKEEQLQIMRSQPTPLVQLEGERDVLARDVEKIQAFVESCRAKIVAMEEGIKEKEKEVETKEAENRRLCAENEELRKTVESQPLDLRNVERIRKEMQAIERDIAEARLSRSVLEEKIVEDDLSIERKLNDLLELVDQCNDAIHKLKLGRGFQYLMNSEGSSPSEVLGSSYKTVLKPALRALADDLKKSCMVKINEKILLESKSQEQGGILKEKKDLLATLQAKLHDAGVQSNKIKKMVEDHASQCELEANRVILEAEGREHQLKIREKEASDFLKKSEQKLQDTINKSKEDIQLCACELLKLIDLISGYKEFMESKISGIKADLSEVTKIIAAVHNASLPSALASTVSTSSVVGGSTSLS